MTRPPRVLTNLVEEHKLMAPVHIITIRPTAPNGPVGRGVVSFGFIGALALIGGLVGPSR
jgi:hypothetical protein